MRPSRNRFEARAFLPALLTACALIAFCQSQVAGAQQFPNPIMLVTSPDPRGLVVADFNHDGHQDLAYVTTGQVPVLHVLLGNGKGGFTEGASVQLPKGACTFEVVACRMVVGDFTHSGHPGILMAWNVYSDWGFIVLPGNGDGTFGAPIVSTLPQSGNPGLDTLVPIQYAVADFNGDGNLDIAAPDYQDLQIRVYLGDGKGNFTAGPTPVDSNAPYAAFAADVNRDGRIDLIVFSRYNQGAEIWLGDGTGNFSYFKTYPALSGYAVFGALAVADVNGDGNLDILGTDGAGNILVSTANGDGTFNAAQTLASGFESTWSVGGVLVPADLTGSGIPDLIVASEEGIDTSVATARLTYGPVQKRTAGPFLAPPVFADFNEDGAPDLAVGVEGGIQFFFGNHTGLFPDSTITPLANQGTFLFAGDFNGDGIADVADIGADGYIRTYAGSKAGALGAPVKSSAPVTTKFDYIGNTVGDFDGDGHQDIALLGQVFYGNGDGTFTPVSLTTVAVGSGNVVAADLNKDGKSDLLAIAGPVTVPGTTAYTYSLLALLGTAQRTFTSVTSYFAPYPPTASTDTPALIAVGDLNGDGHPDAAVYDPNVSALETWLGNGDGSFHSASSQSLTGSPWTPQGAGGQVNTLGAGLIADLDGDGNADLAFLATETAPDTIGQFLYVLIIQYGDGKGGFNSTQIIPLSHSYTMMTSTRLTTGALLSIVLSDGSVIGVLRNLGGRLFSNEDFYSAGTMTGLLVADFNGDGLGDLLPLRASAASSPPGGEQGLTILLNQAEAASNGNGVVNGALSSTPSIVNYNQGFTLTATLSASTAGAPAPTGTVNFYAQGLPLGSVTLSSGSASIPVAGSVTQSLSPGFITITANYSGDSYYAPADLATSLQILNPSYATQTTLTLSAGGATISSIQAASFVTMVAAVAAPVAVPYGYIAFFDGGNVIAQAEISNGQASFSTNLLAIGNHSLSAQYLGYSPANWQGGLSSFQASTSTSVGLAVTAVPTAVSLSSSTSTGTTGAVLTLTANLTSPVGPPIGAVTFYDGSAALETLTLDANGTAAFSSASLTAGLHSFTAQYTANGIFAGSVSSSKSVTLAVASPGLARTLTQINSVLPSVSSENLVTVEVTGAPDQSGSVSILLDGRLATSASLTADMLAVVPLAMSGAGTHTLVASYSGSAQAAPSASSPLSVTAFSSGQDFTLQAGQSQIAQGAGGALPPIPLSISAVNGWSGTVALRCVSGLPAGYSCSFSPPSVSGSGVTTLALQAPGAASLAGLLLLPCILVLRRRSARARLLAILLAGVFFLSLSACNAPQPPASIYVITVEADSGSLVHSVQVQVAINQ
jgi:hypothetical protein